MRILFGLIVILVLLYQFVIDTYLTKKTKDIYCKYKIIVQNKEYCSVTSEPPVQLLCNMNGASFVGRFVRMNSHPYRLEHKPSTSYLSYERIAGYA